MTPKTRTATIGPTYFWGIFMFSAFALLALFYFRFSAKPEAYEAERAKVRLARLEALSAEDGDKLQTYKLLDPAKGTVQIPIARAMELVAADLKAKAPAASAVKVEDPYPYGLMAPAAPAAAPAADPAASPAAAGSPAPAPAAPAQPAATPAAAAQAPAAAAPAEGAASPAPAASPAASPGQAPAPAPAASVPAASPQP